MTTRFVLVKHPKGKPLTEAISPVTQTQIEQVWKALIECGEWLDRQEAESSTRFAWKYERLSEVSEETGLSILEWVRSKWDDRRAPVAMIEEIKTTLTELVTRRVYESLDQAREDLRSTSGRGLYQLSLDEAQRYSGLLRGLVG